PSAKSQKKPEKKEPAPPPAEIGIEEFAKVDLRVGRVMSAEVVPDANKLLKLQVDLGEGRLRQIFAGLRPFYPDPAVLVGRNVIVVANLKPRQMKFGLSEGMVLAAGERPQTLTVDGAQPFSGWRDVGEVAQAVLAERPRWVGISLQNTEAALASLSLARILKQLGYCGRIVCGGHFATLNAEEILNSPAGVDVVVRFAGEEALVGLLR